jgi:hypothetical protein
MKKIGALFIIVVCLLFSNESSAQLTVRQQQNIDKLFKTSKVVYFNFKVRSMQEIAGFSKLMAVDRVKGAQVFAHANKAQFTQFAKMNYPYTVMPNPAAKKKAAAKATTTTKKATTTKK